MLRKLRLSQENDFFIKKIVYAKEDRAKTLVDIMECSFEISSKGVIFRAGGNTLLKYKHFVNS